MQIIPKHPEQSEDEVLIANCKQADIYNIPGWTSVRVGQVAYDVNGNRVNGLFPIFVSKKEIAFKKLDYMLDPNWNIFGVKFGIKS